ncbi:hypothetical protein Btru_045940 [Bulinus truncatus]|nr:hypothetical protein Btru_045940 [Bulinus truncatus]
MITSNSNNTAGVGTFKWMAPEVINGCGDTGGNKGFKADIRSTGVTVVEMATGKPIFPDSTDMDAILKIGSGERPEYRLPANSPKDLKEFLDEVLAIDPDKRPTADGLLTRPFLEVDKFNLYYLPDNYRDHDIVLLINHLAKLVVKVKVSYISVDRPARHKGAKYPGYEARGTNKELSGSGRVWDVYSHLEEEEESRPCECRECIASGAPKKSWGEVNILTAKHVVFDESEAKFTSCFLNFNNRYSRPITLTGTGVGWNDLEEDICYLRCVTHDVGLVGRLREGLDAFNRQCDVVYKKYKDVVPSADFIAVVSHPHGWYKQVSFGSCSQVKKNNDGGSIYHYTACTCSGSSGAPVYYINKRELRWVTHHHIGTATSGTS